jgi:hypothetical protein
VFTARYGLSPYIKTDTFSLYVLWLYFCGLEVPYKLTHLTQNDKVPHI